MNANAAVPATPFSWSLANAAEIETLRESSQDFADFLAAARRDSGRDVRTVNVHEATYKVVLAQGQVHYDLRYEGRIGSSVASASLPELLDATLSQPRDALIHAVWTTRNLADLKELLMAMRATARFVMNTRGELQGQVVLARGTVALIEQLQSGHPHLPNGEPAVESITRNLGIRTRVKMLMAAKPDDGTQPAPGEDTRTRVFRWKA